MFKINVKTAVLLFFLVYILTCFANPGFMGTDEYWTGITRYVPAQEKNLSNMMSADDVKSPTQIMPLLGLSHLALGLGFQTPYEQYRFVQIFVGVFSTLLLGFALLIFWPREKHLFVFLTFTFYFAAAFAFTRPMYESLSAPWILVSALSLRHYLSNPRLRWVLLSVVGVSVAFLLRPQAGVCALGLLGFLGARRDGRALTWACIVGAVFFIAAGIPDIYLREGFHSSLKGILFYNVQHGADYARMPWFYYGALMILLLWLPFWLTPKMAEVLKKLWPEHKVFWVYIILLLGLHSLFPQKWERFAIPVLPLIVLILSDWVAVFWAAGERRRIAGLAFINFIIWIPATFFPSQKNIIDMSLYLNSHPEIQNVIRYNKSPQWITEVFIQRKDWSWAEAAGESLPSQLRCNERLVMNEGDFEKSGPSLKNLTVEKIFKTNLIEKAAYKLNPAKNIRRTPLILLKMSGC